MASKLIAVPLRVVGIVVDEVGLLSSIKGWRIIAFEDIAEGPQFRSGSRRDQVGGQQ